MDHFEYLGIKIYLSDFKPQHWIFFKGNEFWKDIPGLEGFYQASTLGRIKSLEKNVKDFCKGGKRSRNYLENIIRQSGCPRKNRPNEISNPYMHVTLRRSLQNKTFKVHRLIAITFIKNPENKPQVNHKNGLKNKNYKSNLEWMTASENQQHAINLGLRHGIKRNI